MKEKSKEFLSVLKKAFKDSLVNDEIKEQFENTKNEFSKTKEELAEQWDAAKEELNDKFPFIKTLTSANKDDLNIGIDTQSNEEKDGFSFFKSFEQEDKIEETENIEEDSVTTDDVTRKLREVKFEDYVLPDINNLKKSSRITREEYERAKKYGENISEMYNSIGMECDFREAEVFDAYTVIKICFKKKKDFEIYKNIIPTLSRWPGYHIAVDNTSGVENSIIILLANNEDGLQIGDVLCNENEDTKNNKAAFGVGIDFNYKPTFCDLSKSKNILIGGTFESGKTTLIQQILISLIHKNNPNEMKIAIFDTMRTNYMDLRDIPHLMWPIITDINAMETLLMKLKCIQQDRLDILVENGRKNIDSFNDAASKNGINVIPRIVVVIDKFDLFEQDCDNNTIDVLSDLMLKGPITGIHFILETSCSKRNILDSRLKTSIGGRMAFKVPNLSDSNLIIDGSGAEYIDAPREILYKDGSFGRTQSIIVPELGQKVVASFFENERNKAKPLYDDSYFSIMARNYNSNISLNEPEDSLYDEVVRYVAHTRAASTSLLQRRFGIGYNRAAKLIDDMEERGIIGPSRGSAPREVYIKEDI